MLQSMPPRPSVRPPPSLLRIFVRPSYLLLERASDQLPMEWNYNGKTNCITVASSESNAPYSMHCPETKTSCTHPPGLPTFKNEYDQPTNLSALTVRWPSPNCNIFFYEK